LQPQPLLLEKTMSQMSPKVYAENLLDRLISLDEQVTGAFFEMGQILSAIEHSKLWDVLGYESFGHLVAEELSFTTSTASKYYNTYRNFKRLGYNKTEALDLIKTFSFTRVAEYLIGATQKVGKRAIANKIEQLLENRRQINFTLNKEDYALVEKALEDHGAEVTDNGRWMHSSEALVDIAKEAIKPAPKTKLRVVG